MIYNHFNKKTKKVVATAKPKVYDHLCITLETNKMVASDISTNKTTKQQYSKKRVQTHENW